MTEFSDIPPCVILPLILHNSELATFSSLACINRLFYQYAKEIWNYAAAAKNVTDRFGYVVQKQIFFKSKVSIFALERLLQYITLDAHYYTTIIKDDLDENRDSAVLDVINTLLLFSMSFQPFFNNRKTMRKMRRKHKKLLQLCIDVTDGYKSSTTQIMSELFFNRYRMWECFKMSATFNMLQGNKLNNAEDIFQQPTEIKNTSFGKLEFYLKIMNRNMNLLV